MSDAYINAIYFTTTTMTTIGYGDTNGDTEIEMVYLMILFFTGIGIFTVIQNEVFNYITEESVESLVEAETEKLHTFLANMSSVIKGKWLNEEIFNDCITNMEETVRFSTKWSLAESKFWDVLSPQIQNKIVAKVLKR